jgi:ABC-type phosphate transport system auxiliary subunit
MTQQEISDYLKENNFPYVSRRQIGYDIDHARNEAGTFVKEHRTNIAEEYKKVYSNLEQLRAEAWRQFSAIKDVNSTVKTSLYDKIQSVNNNILTMLSVGDVIELEMIKTAQEAADSVREDLDKIVEQCINSQADF